METLIGQLIMLGTIVMIIVVASWFRMHLRWKIEGRSRTMFSKEIDYEIYYRDQLIKDGVFQIKNNESVRFGFSERKEYFNSIILEHYLHLIEDLDEDDVKEMKEEYSTWFSIKMSANQMWVTPSYSQRENRKGHKNIYTDGKVLDKKGETFDGGITVHSKENQMESFRVIIYDRFQQLD